MFSQCSEFFREVAESSQFLCLHVEFVTFNCWYAKSPFWLRVLLIVELFDLRVLPRFNGRIVCFSLGFNQSCSSCSSLDHSSRFCLLKFLRVDVET